ncbi:MAG: ribonuclease P protein component [Anaerolineae bacterium]
MRLRRPEDFRKVRSEGRSWAHPFVVLWAAPSDLERTRIGITASRRVGNAVARNRARRLLRESVRHLYSCIAEGWDIVLVARTALLGAHEPEVRDALRSILESANLLCVECERPECTLGSA